jgi:hypothetical protein
MLRRAALLPLILLLTGCRSQPAALAGGGVLAPSVSAVIDARIQPQIVALDPVFGLRCPAVPPFATTFDLVVQELTGIDMFLDQVSLQVLDGTNLGGSPIVFPRADLTRLFPSTLITGRGSRAFRFSPQFGCGIGVPQILIVNTIFLDGFGTQHRSTIRAAIR